MTKLVDVLKKLEIGEELDERYRTHILKGQYEGLSECHIEPDWLLIYALEEATLYLVRTGTHSDLF